MEARWKKLFEEEKLEFHSNTTLSQFNSADYMAKYRNMAEFVVGPPLAPFRHHDKSKYEADFIGIFRIHENGFIIGDFTYGGHLTHDEEAGCVYGDPMHYDQKESDWEMEKYER